MTTEDLKPGLVLGTVGRAAVLQYRPWTDATILHGFSGCLPEGVALDRELYEEHRVKQLCLLHQVHGCTVLDLRTLEHLESFLACAGAGLPYPESFQADAVVLPRQSDYNHKNLAFAVRTADCIPALILSDSAVALVHAGWRGLAARILTRVLELLLPTTEAKDITILLGPCAGPDRYEVGSEVVDALGEHAVAHSLSNEKFLLDLHETAKREIFAGPAEPVCIRSSICTITDKNYYSYRRQGAEAGRNLAFFVLNN